MFYAEHGRGWTAADMDGKDVRVAVSCCVVSSSSILDGSDPIIGRLFLVSSTTAVPQGGGGGGWGAGAGTNKRWGG